MWFCSFFLNKTCQTPYDHLKTIMFDRLRAVTYRVRKRCVLSDSKMKVYNQLYFNNMILYLSAVIRPLGRSFSWKAVKLVVTPRKGMELVPTINSQRSGLHCAPLNKSVMGIHFKSKSVKSYLVLAELRHETGVWSWSFALQHCLVTNLQNVLSNEVLHGPLGP